ncbi:MAG: CPBP family intramembrane metalloprotease [Gammaproteobacteria bacterium]
MNPAGGDEARRGPSHRYLLLASIGIFPFLVNGPINAEIAHLPYLYWGFELSIWVLLPAILLHAATRTPGFSFADLGLQTAVRGYREPVVLLLACLVIAPLCYWVYDGVFEAFDRWYPDGGFFHYETVIPESGFPRLTVIIYFAASAGLVEEFLFRGLLHRAAQEFRRPRLFFLVVSPLAFSLIHWESGIANLLATWVFGLFTAAVFLGLRNLWPLIAGHALTDLLEFY